MLPAAKDLRDKNRRQSWEAGFWSFFEPFPGFPSGLPTFLSSTEPHILGLKYPRRRLNAMFACKTGGASTAQITCGDEPQRSDQAQQFSSTHVCVHGAQTLVVLRRKTTVKPVRQRLERLLCRSPQRSRIKETPEGYFQPPDPGGSTHITP